MFGKPKEIKVDVASLTAQEGMQKMEFDIEYLEVSIGTY